MGLFVCSFCGNSDEKYIGYINDAPYCRKCIMFCGENVERVEDFKIRGSDLFLDYELSPKQRDISEKVKNAFNDKKDVLIHAVCGAGKTELVFDLIQNALKQKMRVGFTIPRKDVVIELAKRFEEAFKTSKITAIYGGHTDLLEGDVVVLTTHQLFRYEKYFDLLIIDEIDAFPYKDNEVLEAFFKRSLRGNYVVLTATPSKKLLSDFQKPDKVIFELLVRYHQKPIPVPIFKQRIGFFKLIFLIRQLKIMVAHKKPVLIFVPTIQKGENLFRLLRLFVPGGNNVSSKTKDRSEIIEDFRNEKYAYLVTTSILERGVTLKNLQVFIYESDHPIYDAATLIQISGRVGRKKGFEDGEVYFLANKNNQFQKEAIETIKHANSFL